MRRLSLLFFITRYHIESYWSESIPNGGPGARWHVFRISISMVKQGSDKAPGLDN